MDALLADARDERAPARRSRPVDLRSVVDATLSSLEPQIEERRASVVVGPLPHVQAMPGLLAVVLDNLISNALKYGPRSDGRVEITAERRSDRWRISVSSEGMPIPAEEAERIFQPFHRVPGERRVPGVGLGLTICARLMERLDGTIGVEPGAESGNTFWISLPAADEALRVGSAPAAPACEPARPGGVVSRLRRRRRRGRCPGVGSGRRCPWRGC